MQDRNYIAIVVSSDSKAYGGSCVENVYMVETIGAEPLTQAMQVFKSRMGACPGKDIELEEVTSFPDIVKRSDITWLTKRDERRIDDRSSRRSR